MIGFLSFIPTNYTGLSELGIISFIGLVVGLITNLIFLPSLFYLIIQKINFKINNNSTHLYKKIINFLSKKKKYVFGTIIIIFVFNLVFIDRLSFNYDAMSLKDQDLPSVKLAKEIIKKNPGSDYIISVVLSELNVNEIDRLQLLLKKKKR